MAVLRAKTPDRLSQGVPAGEGIAERAPNAVTMKTMQIETEAILHGEAIDFGNQAAGASAAPDRFSSQKG